LCGGKKKGNKEKKEETTPNGANKILDEKSVPNPEPAPKKTFGVCMLCENK